MKTKVSEATGPVLDWMVAKCEGALEPVGNVRIVDLRPTICVGNDPDYDGSRVEFCPSTNWSQGGPIIDRLMLEKGLVLRCWVERGQCQASLDFPYKFSTGPTPLVATMRCFVASKLGDEVDVPDELA